MICIRLEIDTFSTLDAIPFHLDILRAAYCLGVIVSSAPAVLCKGSIQNAAILSPISVGAYVHSYLKRLQPSCRVLQLPKAVS